MKCSVRFIQSHHTSDLSCLSPYSPSEICVCTRQGAPVFTSTRTTYYPSRSGSSRRAPATRTACAGRTRCVPCARAPFHLTSYQFPTVSRPNHACRTPDSRRRFEEASTMYYCTAVHVDTSMSTGIPVYRYSCIPGYQYIRRVLRIPPPAAACHADCLNP